MATIETMDPSTGKVLNLYKEMSVDRVNAIIDEVASAAPQWQSTSFTNRSSLMKRCAEILRDQAKPLAELMAQEMGKTLKSGLGEIEKCAWGCDYYAENAEIFLASEIVQTGAQKSMITFQPLGVVLAIMPWNFPFWQVFRFAAPTLMAGNVALLKHASNTTGCALAIETLFEQAGFPKNVFRTLIASNELIDDRIAHPKIAAVTLTGSVTAGKIVASIAGAHLKKQVLELGGSDPYLILEDADLEQAVKICVASRLTNAGQSCVAAKRFIVPNSIKSAFEEQFVEKMRSIKMGNPFKDDVDMGPQARYDLRDKLHQQVMTSIEAGAKCLLGGTIPNMDGAYYPPTVLTDVSAGMPAYDEELFGPVAAIISVENEQEAIRIANDTSFGLGAAIFTQNLEKAETIAVQHLQAGMCFVNGLVKSDPRLPFGGIKESGYGRELSAFGIREFVNVKSVVIS